MREQSVASVKRRKGEGKKKAVAAEGSAIASGHLVEF